ncbi:MAG: DNA-directed RNA polymerase subunit beta' [Parcubacteria group bacterium CG1_02_40_25]|nr:MAG: DNA-directed RNA polymerase subunit beta' [Parcubacteria group bacterium CG1_02_40_25]
MSISKTSDFKSIRLKLASPEDILNWSRGEVLKAETINYRTQRPEKDGLFCEKIFGPSKDWECYCGKYRGIRYKGIICDKCGVELTRASVRRERMGHIKLATPVAHIWFLRNIPSRIGLILDISVQKLERVIYFGAYIILEVNEQAREKVLASLKSEYKQKIASLTDQDSNKNQKIREREKIKERFASAEKELKELRPQQILSELQYNNLARRYGEVFEAGIGAESIAKLLAKLDLNAILADMRKQIQKSSVGALKNLLRRVRLLEGLVRNGLRPEWMVLNYLPVLPPDLRPMVQLDGGRYASSDLNDLYRRVINRNNRLKRLIELNAPEVICRNEKRMLQEAVDALIDNSARHGVGALASTGPKRQLKSLADMLKGKQGRFRQNLLGKRVDYSGRAVIVVNPRLKLYQCGMPKRMALEIFRPFIIQQLIERELAHNVRSAGRLIEEAGDEVWEILEKVIQGRCVLLNRAPTLHRLGIQAFQPVLIEGSALQIHPLVCRAFNADFDGDQMAVHLPLGEQAQREAREIMLSSLNLLKPATGDPIAVPTQDMVLGIYWMTSIQDDLKGEGRVFATDDEAVLAYQLGQVHLRAKIKVLTANLKTKKAEVEVVKKSLDKTKTERNKDSAESSVNFLTETSIGRIIFNQVLPEDFNFVNIALPKKELYKIVADLIANYQGKEATEFLDKIKDLGFEFATRSGISWGMDDLKVPPEKVEMLKQAQSQTAKIRQHFEAGLLTSAERKSSVIEVWARTTQQIGDVALKELDKNGSVYTIVYSGARGSWGVVYQMIGMRGLMTNPAGEIIELPVRGCFKEGLNGLEYFISTHGARKGLADTALRTAVAGYLTRRLVDVAQDIVVKEHDCGTKNGIVIYREDGKEFNRSLGQRIIGRVSLQEVKDGNKIIVGKGELIDQAKAKLIDQLTLDKIEVRSIVACETRYGVCQTCYGYDLGKNQIVSLGEAVGIVTAQAIGEPGTQLTMKTFHTGGVAAGGDITQGLPRVEEIFEMRPPKGRAIIVDIDGQIAGIRETAGGERIIKILPQGKRKTTKDYVIPANLGVRVAKGDLVQKGDQLSEGHIDLKEFIKTAGKEAVQRYIINQVISIYINQGENIDEKHIELIVRKMFSRVRITDAGDTEFLPGEVVEKDTWLEANNKIEKENKKPATAVELFLGVSRVALSTDSFLSAASFQETSRVLIEASVRGKQDYLRGLKENVIIGKLIPAGTGFRQ